MTINSPEKTNIEMSASQSDSPFDVFGLDVLNTSPTIGQDRPFIPALPPDGSVLGAAWRNHHMVGNYLNRANFREFEGDEPDYDYLSHIPADLFEQYGHMYAQTTNSRQAEALTGQLRREIEDGQIMANSHWRTFLSVFAVNLIDPSILLPGGTIYKNTKAAYSVGRSAMSVSAAAMAGEAVQQTVAQNTQLTRSWQESAFDIVGAGVVGGVLGGIGGSFAHGAVAKKFKKEVIETLADEGPIGPKMTPDQSLSAMASRDPDYEKEIYSIYGGTPTAAIGKFLGYATQKLTPFGRLIYSPFATSKAIANEMMEHNLLINANLPHMKKVMGPDGKEIEKEVEGFGSPENVESAIKARKSSMYNTLSRYQDIFYKQAGINGAFKQMKTNFTHQGMKLGDWEKAVWRSMVTGKKNSDASVNEAVDLINREFFDPIRDEYIRLGLFPEDINPKTASNYFMRVYNREKIRDPVQRAKTKAKFEAWIKRNNEELIELDAQIKPIQERLEKLKKEGASAEDLKIVEKELQELVPYYLWNSSGEIRKVIDPDYYSVEAENIIDNILGMGEERNLNPILSMLPNSRTNVLRERQFLIDDIEIEDELVTSFSEVAPMFMNATVPNIELMRYAKRLGVEEGSDARSYKLNLLEQDYKREVERNPQNEKKLYKRYQADKRDIEATFDIINGIYGLGPNTLDNSAARFVKNLSAYNYIRLMGQITLQALTDLGSIGIKHGIFRTLNEGFLPVLKELKSGGYDKEFLQDLGFASNTLQGYRLKAMIDQDPMAGQTGLFTRALDYLSQGYGNATLFNQWSDAMEFIAGKTSIARTLRAINDFGTTGKIKKKEQTRLNNLGITKEHYQKIFDQFKKHGGQEEGSFWINWGKWDVDNDSLAALHQFKHAVLKEIDQTVVAGPGIGEKPLFARRGVGSLLFQFKGFSYAMTNKVLISGLQRGDAEFLQGFFMLNSLALLSWAATTLARGDELNLDETNIFKEMIDRSGITGVYGNFYNVANKLRLIPGQEVTRYRNRGVWSTLGGPSVGLVEDSLSLLQKVMHIDDRDLTSKDFSKFLRLWTPSNYYGVPALNKKLSKAVAGQLGLEDDL